MVTASTPPATPAPAGPQPLTSRQLLDRATWISVAVIVLSMVVFLAVPELRGGQDVPALAAVGLLAGAPHGAVDHLLPQSDGWPLRGRALVGLLAVYIAVVGAVLAVTLAAPVIGIAAVIVFSVVHLGSADAALARERRGQPPRYGPVSVLAYGGPVGFISFARWPRQVRSIFGVISPQIAGTLRVPMLVAAAATAVAAAVFVFREVRRGEWVDATEVLALVFFALAVPPLAAFGIYFSAWHSLRQYVRLYADARQPDARQPDARRPDAGGPDARGRAGARRYPLPRTFNPGNLFSTMAIASAATTSLAAAAVGVLRLDAGVVQRYHVGDWLTVLLAAVVTPHMITILRYDRWKVAHAGPVTVSPRRHAS
jgi:Brp/Blh family beta-carotene 15,15'-monooxygenase